MNTLHTYARARRAEEVLHTLTLSALHHWRTKKRRNELIRLADKLHEVVHADLVQWTRK